MVAVTQHSFAAGEVSPGFWGRTDHARYKYGVRKAENLVVTSLGALRKRPGMELFQGLGAPARMFYIGTASGTIPAALFRSKIVVFSSPSAQTINIATHFYSEDDLNKVQICQLGDTVTFVLDGHRPLELLNANGTFSVRVRPAVYRDNFYWENSKFPLSLKNGLLGWYEFSDSLKSSLDETEPTPDTTGSYSFQDNGRGGKCLGFPVSSSSSVQNQIVYSDDYSESTFGDFLNLWDTLDEFSFSLWVKPSSSGYSYMAPFSIGRFGVEIYRSTGAVYVYTPTSTSLNARISLDEWSHLVITCQRSFEGVVPHWKLTLYVNGGLVDYHRIYSTPSAPSYLRFRLGAMGPTSSTGTPVYQYSGLLDSLGIWKRCLSAGEARQLYNNGQGISWDDTVQTNSFLDVAITTKLNENISVGSSSWEKGNLYDVNLENCPEDYDHPKLPWVWRFGFVWETSERGEFEALSDSFTYQAEAACYTDYHSHVIYVSVPNEPTAMKLKALKVYRGRNGIFGLVKRSEVADIKQHAFYYSSTDWGAVSPALTELQGNFFEVIDDGSTPDMSQQPPVPLEDDPEIFCSENSYPNSMGWFEQRTVFGGHAKKPRTLFMSKSGQRYEFTKNGEYAPLDSDAMALDLATAEHERIKAVTSLNGRLIVLTDRNLWACGSTGQAMTPSDASAVCYNGVGCNGLKPLALRNSLLFISQHGNEIFEIRADQQGTQWATRELGMFARHLLDGHRIVSWDYQSTPDPVVWLVREDGVLLSMSYNAETDLCAWTRHKTNAAVKSVCVIGTDVYLSVVRNGVWQAEKMPMQGSTYFLDGKRVVESPTQASSVGLKAWNVFSPASSLAQEGTEKLDTLPVRASGSGSCLAGDAVDSTVEFLDAVSFEDVGLRPKTLKKISVDFVSNSSLSLSEDMKGRSTPERLNGTSERRISFAFVIHGYGAEATGAIRSSLPCPLTLLGVAREVDFGDTSMPGAGSNAGGR